ncbi:MAG: enoyl-CoA hydratase/isomerase family protein [Leptospira sp.]|nr:enoyl-CoA hydratase/isomerase family protein [Leptospira sp.]
MPKYIQEVPHDNNKILELKIASGEKNTFHAGLLEEIIEITRNLRERILSGSEETESLRAVLLTSSEGKYFSNGLDPSLFLDKSREEIEDSVSLLIEASQRYFFLPIPTIAVIEGHCIAAGAVFALFSDYRFMLEGSGRIGFPEVAIDLNFPSFPTRVLAELVGRQKARDLLYSGKLLKPLEAEKMGLIDGCFTPSNRKELDRTIQMHAKMSLASARGIKCALKDYFNHNREILIQEDVRNLTDAIASPLAQESFRKISQQ